MELRVFVGSVEALMPARHRLNTAIARAFRQSGLGFAFAQSDAKVRSSEGAAALTAGVVTGGILEQPRQKAA